MVWAHSANGNDERHALVDHLRGTAELAARFASSFGGDDIARWLGLLHDVGKASCGWQAGLLRAESAGGPVGLDHKTLGAQLALEYGLGKFSMAVQGHHGGLTSPQNLSTRLKNLSPDERSRNENAERTVRALLPELVEVDRLPLPAAWQDPLVAEMALRLVFSALCDADFLDTAAHFAGVDRPDVHPDADFSVLRDRFEARRSELLAQRKRSEIDAIRAEVYEGCVKAAYRKRGIFKLAAPTGSGKTMSAAAFALHHAAEHGMRRVIVAVPFLTITEQNAEVYRDLLDGPDGEPVVLEHHSQVDLDGDQVDRRWHRLAAENWDAPFVVTTTVRLFEALFDRKPAAMRRVHRLAGAVIVLDEVQALPHRMLVPILDGLRTLVTHFGATVLLSSATQPDFWQLSPFRELKSEEIIEQPETLVSRLRRVSFVWRTNPSPTLDELANESAGLHQAMVVLNTTADAARVFDRWRQIVPAGTAWHLSTRMCPDHRRRVLTTVRRRLSHGEPTLLVSTQLIEAGVDVDFPVVYRALAPADSLLQAAGRANREGNLEGLGLVIFVDPPDAGRPPSYRTLVGSTRVCFGPSTADPDDLDALRNYYGSIYGSLNLAGPEHVGNRIQQARRRFDFQAVTDGPADPYTTLRDRTLAFRMIENDGVSVVTPSGAADIETTATLVDLLDEIRSAPRPERWMLRRLQPYTTTVHRSALRRPGVLPLMRHVLGEPGQLGSLAEWVGDYDEFTGITLDPHAEDFVC